MLVEVKLGKVCSAAATRRTNLTLLSHWPSSGGPLSLRLSRLPPLLRARDIVVGRDAQRGTVEIVIPPALERPQKAGNAMCHRIDRLRPLV